MKIALTGFNGFVANSLRQQLKEKGFEFIEIPRNCNPQQCSSIISGSNAVINLAGAPVIQRWNKKAKKEIYNSRIFTTQKLVDSINSLPKENRPKVLISASAIGYYPTDNQTRNESHNESGNGFMACVCQEWEQQALKLDTDTTRLIIPRIGIVLGKNGGMLKKMIPLFKKGLGAKIGTGKSTMSFIHIDDLLNAFQYFIENEQCNGIYNLTAPIPTTNARFTKELALRTRKALLRTPAFSLKIIYGEAAQVIIGGENVIPQRLIDEDFEFKYPSIQLALNEIV